MKGPALPYKSAVLAAGLLLLSTRAFAADRQLRPFIGTTFRGATTVVDPGDGTINPSITLGGSAVFLGEIFGAEAEIADIGPAWNCQCPQHAETILDEPAPAQSKPG